MEFSYRVSEEDFLRAWNLRCKSSIWHGVFRAVLYWAFIFFCLMLLRGVLWHDAGPGEAGPRNLWGTPLGVFLLAGLPVLLVYRYYAPRRIRLLYQKDPAMQAQFDVNVAPASFSGQISSGASWQTGWNHYDYWREGHGLVVLVLRSGSYSILNLAGLSEAQRHELRGILRGALPGK
jgi:hypothetical protein